MFRSLTVWPTLLLCVLTETYQYILPNAAVAGQQIAIPYTYQAPIVTTIQTIYFRESLTIDCELVPTSGAEIYDQDSFQTFTLATTTITANGIITVSVVPRPASNTDIINSAQSASNTAPTGSAQVDAISIDSTVNSQYLGCYAEGDAHGGRLLQGDLLISRTLTNSQCHQFCRSLGYAIAGSEYGLDCYCSAILPASATLTSDCSTPCLGNASQMCGGNSALSIYRLYNVTTPEFGAPYTKGGQTNSTAIDIFAPISVDGVTARLASVAHNILPKGIAAELIDLPVHTNKQYAQLFVGSQSQAVSMEPYLFNFNGQGFAVQNADAKQFVYEQPTYTGLLGLEQLVVSASEFQSGTATLAMDNSKHASVNANIRSGAASLNLPLVSGMGLITVVYSNATPVISTNQSATFSSVTAPAGAYSKFKIELLDGSRWLVYVLGSTAADFTATSSALIASAPFTGTIQIAKIPELSDALTGETALDSAIGTWVTGITLRGSTTPTNGTYALDYVKAGDISKKPLVFALPHHQELLGDIGATGIRMQTATHGIATAFRLDSLEMTDPDIPFSIGFLPDNTSAIWSQAGLLRLQASLPKDIYAITLNHCISNSTYLDGKCFSRAAQLCLLAHDVVQDATLAGQCLGQLKEYFAKYVSNDVNTPFYYDTTWKGVNALAAPSRYSYGLPDYNDHHFTYGYFIYTAALIAYLDPTWISNGNNTAFVDMLIRDVANPVEDAYFPQFRSMDWYVGHSIAAGIGAELVNGKDEESSSEDFNFSFAVKLWGHVTDNAALEGLGNVMLAVNKRSINAYMLLGPENAVQPAVYNHNYVSGILYANQLDYDTFFGNQVQFIHGIHMLPTTAVSSYIRSKAFVGAQWDAILKNATYSVDAANFKGIIMQDLAIAQPQTSYDFFSGDYTTLTNSFPVDLGQSVSWALAYGIASGAVAT